MVSVKFHWTLNGQTSGVDSNANLASYMEIVPDSPGPYGIQISGEDPTTAFICSLKGEVSVLPPATGTYPISLGPQSGAFMLDCHDWGAAPGSVVLTKSTVGDIEGTFAAQSDVAVITGVFAVGCAPANQCPSEP